MVSHEILAACRRGDPKAFEEVVRRTYRHVYTQALRLVGDRQDAEDVAQEAYLRVFRGLAGFRGEAQFETWLYRIVANAAMSYLRRRQRFGAVLSEPADEDASPWELASDVRVAEEAVDRDALTKALQELPLPLRTVLVLKDVYGLSCEEIAQQFGTTEGAIKVRLHRGRKRLKGMLFAPEEDRGDV
jgi:RNA polymerase sigma-70 factor (ECF subfamily)